jgi:hypothetical protein
MKMTVRTCPNCQQPLPAQAANADVESIDCPSCGVRLKRNRSRTPTPVAVVPTPTFAPPVAIIPIAREAEVSDAVREAADRPKLPGRSEFSALLGLFRESDTTRADTAIVVPREPTPVPLTAPPPPATPPPVVQPAPRPAPRPRAAAQPAPATPPPIVQPAPAPAAAARPAPAPAPTPRPSLVQPAPAAPPARVAAAPAPAPAPPVPPAAAPETPRTRQATLPTAPLRPAPPAAEPRPPEEISPAPAIETPAWATQDVELNADPDADPLSAPRPRVRRKARLVARTAVLMATPSLLVLGWALATGRLTPPLPPTPLAASHRSAGLPASTPPKPAAPAPPAPTGTAPPPADNQPPPANPSPPSKPTAAETLPEETAVEPLPADPPSAPRTSLVDRGATAGAPDESAPDEPSLPASDSPDRPTADGRRRSRPKPEQKPQRRQNIALAGPSSDAGREAYLRGNESLLSGDTAAALKAYREAIAVDPENPSGYRGLGLAYAESGNRKAAIRFLRVYLGLAPKAPDRRLIKKRLRHLIRAERR